MDAYSNMSAPPRSKIRVAVKPVGEHLLVKLPSHCNSICSKLWSMNNDSDRASWLQRFVDEHRQGFDAVVRPMGFIVPINARVSDYSPFRTLPVVYDLFLSLSLLGRMSGGIYIPRREISYNDSLFGCYAFPAKYFPQYCGGRGATALPDDGRARTPCAPQGGSFELTTFLSLFRIRFSEKTKTACVTCGESPELLLNKEFIEAHCQTNEHLYMLVMHELYHVILGHTRLFPHATEVRNLVFDAVINAILCALFPKPEFTSFFTDYYPADKMPFAILRPKGEGTPLAAESALKLLYGGSDTGTYHDVYEALLKSGCVKEMTVLLGVGRGATALPGDGRARTPCAPHLLGSHGEEDEEMSAEMKELIQKIISKWPSPDRPLQGQDLGAEERERNFGAEADTDARLRRGIRRLMRMAALPGRKETRRRSVRERLCETATFLPDWHDRSHEAREVALGDALIYSTTTRLQRPSSRANSRAFVYFDVSGSVADEVPSVAQTLLPYCRGGLCTVHVFSTVVHPASARALAARKFSSTGGTDIDCVLKHVLELPPRKRPRVVVVTDGFTGKPDAALAERFHMAGMRLFVGLVKSNAGYDQESDLSSIAEKFIRLY